MATIDGYRFPKFIDSKECKLIISNNENEENISDKINYSWVTQIIIFMALCSNGTYGFVMTSYANLCVTN